MPAEIQEKPSVKPMDKTEYDSMETPVSKGTKPDRNTGFLKVFCVIVVCLFCLIAGNLVRSNSTLFLEHRTENGYLAPEEYILVDSKTGKPGQNVRTIGLHSMSTNHEYRMRTTRGIGKGSSWQEVVDAYGQMILSKETQNDFERIDLSDKADGLYLLRVVTSNGITTKQLIKK